MIIMIIIFYLCLSRPFSFFSLAFSLSFFSLSISINISIYIAIYLLGRADKVLKLVAVNRRALILALVAGALDLAVEASGNGSHARGEWLC
jgi:hypothetical protein